jgi:hypothetical protein
MTTASSASALAELAVDAARLDRRAVGGEHSASAARPFSSACAQLGDPVLVVDTRAGCGRPARAAPSLLSPATVGTLTWARCASLSTTCATCALPNRPKPRRKSSGVPSTTTRSARCLSNPRVRRNDSSWRAGNVPRPRPLKKHGTRRCSTAARSSSHAPSQYTSLPTMNAGRSAAAISSASAATSSGSERRRDRRTHRPRAVATRTRRPNTSSGKSRNVGPRCGRHGQPWPRRAPSAPAFEESFTVAADLVIDCITGTWSNSCSEPLPQRASGARPPSTTTGAPLNHTRDRRHPVGDARPRGERGEAGLAGELGVRLGGERRGLLVAGVDHPHALVARRVVQRPDVATVEREHDVGAECHQRGDRLLPGMPFDAPAAAWGCRPDQTGGRPCRRTKRSTTRT